MNKALSFRLICGAALCVGAMGVGSAINVPAMAAGGYGHGIFPIVSATCDSSSPCLEESNRTGAGIEGTSKKGNGVIAISNHLAALFAQNTGTGEGVEATSKSGNGTSSNTLNNSKLHHNAMSGVWGHDDSSDGGHLNVGVAGSSTFGMGMEASSIKYIGANVIGGGAAAGNDYPALSVVGNPGHPLITACTLGDANPCDMNHARFLVDGFGGIFARADIGALGNVDIGGQYQVNGNCVAGCAHTRDRGGKAVRRYVPTSSVPSVEDYGEAQLVQGQAHVQLSRDFANVIDSRAGYLVFITPEGDTDGVFVTQKTSGGFVVRENRGGRASVAFQYRIVARPYGDRGSRLPTVATGG